MLCLFCHLHYQLLSILIPYPEFAMLNTESISNVYVDKTIFRSPMWNINLKKKKIKSISLLVFQNAFFLYHCGSFSYGLLSLVYANQITHVESYSDLTGLFLSRQWCCFPGWISFCSHSSVRYWELHWQGIFHNFFPLSYFWGNVLIYLSCLV